MGELDFKEILTHILLILLLVTCLWLFAANVKWLRGPSSLNSMEAVQTVVTKKWRETKGGGRGSSYAKLVLELRGTSAFQCSGSAQVTQYVYKNTNVGDELSAFRDGRNCYLRGDRRWQDGYRAHIMIYGIAGLLCMLIETWLLFRLFRS